MSKTTQEELDRWSKEVKRGAVTLAILALLSRERAYGYELVKRLDDKMAFLALEQGTVYPLLRRLEKRELLKSEWDADDPSKPKKYYTVTKQGLMALGAMSQDWSTLSREMREVLSEVNEFEQ
jgi:DNA-binding PadR family transcriptional regulator